MSIEGLTSHRSENATRYHAASEEDIEFCIDKALEILEETGMVVDRRTSEFLAASGCEVEGDTVKLPRTLVMDCINSTPSHFSLYKRSGKPAMDVGGTNVYFGNGPANPFVDDPETGERRLATLDDTASYAALLDRLPEFDFVMHMPEPGNFPAAVSDTYAVRVMLEHTDKPIVLLPRTLESCIDQIGMIAAFQGDMETFHERPSALVLTGDPSSPLTLADPEIGAKILWCAEHGVPYGCTSIVQPGTTAPITVAGAVTLGLAENLFCLAMGQLKNPGCPYIGGIDLVTIDMQTVYPCYGSPEHCLAESVVADIYHYLDLPFLGTAGASDSKTVDSQLAVEQAFTVLVSALDGGNLVHNGGFLDGGMTSNMSALVIQNELISYARRVSRGVRFDDETVGIRSIAEAMRSGTFLTTKHTIDHYRDEVWESVLLDHTGYQVWKDTGEKTMTQRARERVRAMIPDPPEPRYVSPAVSDRLDAVIARANRRAGYDPSRTGKTSKGGLMSRLGSLLSGK